MLTGMLVSAAILLAAAAADCGEGYRLRFLRR